MTDTIHSSCGYAGDREGTVVAYLYDDIHPIERASFEAHLATCSRCRAELAELGGVRARLGRWAPPEPRVPMVDRQGSAADDRRPWWRQVPAWAQVAAALLFLGIAAGVANLDVRYGREGLTVHTGWPTAPAAVEPATGAPWRGDLAALEQQLRTEMRATQASGAGREAVGVDDQEIVRRVRGLVDESERRQRRELALRLAEVLRDLNVQRTADLARIDRSLGIVQNNTGVEVARQRELLNYLVRVSSQK